jgi:predicted nucleotide-binding protein (sugar kinase/HSP70/actin superfamily)
MIVTYPHLGPFGIVMHGLLTDLGLEVLPPPPITKKTVTLGVRHSPEFACFPLKLNMGNFIESLDAGADTIVMAGGTGPCRFGYYAQVQREILRDLGYEFNMIVLEPPQGHMQELTDKLKELCGERSWPHIMRALHTAWRKIKALDKMHAQSLKVRPREEKDGATTRAYEQAVALLEGAKTPREIERCLREGLQILAAVPINREKEVLRIGIVGEVYMLVEPYANLQVEKVLGEMGVEVDRSIYISHWIKEHLVLSSLGIKGSKETKKAAAPYLNHFVGGHGWESIGDTVRYARKGYDGVVHILPFTCTPEIVAQSILPTVSRQEGIPVMTFSMDEQSGSAGFVTRLEAFIDLLSQRRIKQQSG